MKAEEWISLRRLAVSIFDFFIEEPMELMLRPVVVGMETTAQLKNSQHSDVGAIRMFWSVSMAEKLKPERCFSWEFVAFDCYSERSKSQWG